MIDNGTQIVYHGLVVCIGAPAIGDQTAARAKDGEIGLYLIREQEKPQSHRLGLLFRGL
jgi:hypothetical protein